MMQKRAARIVLTTGGTGGHIFPALAVADQIKQQCPEAEVLFIGSNHGPEARLAAQAGLAFAGLPVRGVLGRGLRSFSALFGMARAVLTARTLLQKFRPDAVLGFGSYASFAPLLAARLSGIPFALHEQNAVPGVANRLLANVAQRVFLSLPDAVGAFPPGKCLMTGNPVRQSIVETGRRHFEGDTDRNRPPRRLLVMGGSQGARAINSVILASLDRLMNAGVEIRHQAGPTDLERVLAGYRAHGYASDNVFAFIEDVTDAYTWADLVLCRAGATSVAELAAAGKPSVLIPFPHATHDHQRRNALALVEAGAALTVAEKDCPSVDLAGMILGLLHDPATLRSMSAAAYACAKPDAAAVVAREMLVLAGYGAEEDPTMDER